LLGGRQLDIVLSDHTDDDGATIFRQACRMGLEGIVSKRAVGVLDLNPIPRRAGSVGRAEAAMIRVRKPNGEAVTDRFKYDVEPMDLANMRQNGARSLAFMCHGCRHEVVTTSTSTPETSSCASSARGWSAPSAAWSAPTSGRTGKSGRPSAGAISRSSPPRSQVSSVAREATVICNAHPGGRSLGEADTLGPKTPKLAAPRERLVHL
jgi:hypothetical protein